MTYNTYTTKVQVTLETQDNSTSEELDRQQMLAKIVKCYGVKIPVDRLRKIFVSPDPRPNPIPTIEEYVEGQDYINPSTLLDIYDVLLAKGLHQYIRFVEKTYINQDRYSSSEEFNQTLQFVVDL